MKLTVQDLAMFIGCEVKIFSDETESYQLNMDIRYLFAISQYDNCPWVFKPVLRSFKSLTDEEVMEFFELTNYFVKGTSDEYKRNRIYLIRDNQQFSYRPENIKWLLTKHIDIFNWIEKGLAIDKTKN